MKELIKKQNRRVKLNRIIKKINDFMYENIEVIFIFTMLMTLLVLLIEVILK